MSELEKLLTRKAELERQIGLAEISERDGLSDEREQIHFLHIGKTARNPV